MKKIFSIFMLLIAFAVNGFGDDTYTLNLPNATSVGAAWDIFNFIAAMFQSNEYTSMLKLFAIFGGFLTFITMTLNPSVEGLKKFAVWIVSLTAILTVVYSHKSSLIVKTDNLTESYYPDTNSSLISSPTTGTVIANLPTAFAYGITAMNTFGNESTMLFQKGLSGVNNNYNIMEYNKDLKGALDLMSSEVSTSNASAATAMNDFMQDCILIPASQDSVYGSMALETLAKTGNMKETFNDLIVNSTLTVYPSMATTGTSDIISTNITLNGIVPANLLVNSVGGTYTCNEFWTNQMQTHLTALRDTFSNQYKDISSGSAELILKQPSVPRSDFEETAIQAGLVNMLASSRTELATNSDIAYSVGKTRAQFVQDSLGTGYLMGQMLPYMQTFIRLFIYAIFPFMIAMSFLPNGWTVLKNYAGFALWVEMWGPIMAILNYFILTHVENTIPNSYTLYNSVNMLSDSAAFAGMAGYLYASVPALSWALLKGTSQVLESIGHGVGSRLAANMGTQALAKDEGRLTQQQLQSESRGKVVSMAEMESLQQRQLSSNLAGSLEGFKTVGEFSNFAQSKFETEIKNSTWQEKVKVAGGGVKDLKELENWNAGSNTAEQVGFKNTVNGSYNPSSAGGTLKGIGANANEAKLNEFGAPLIQDTTTKKELNTQAGDVGLHQTTTKEDNLKKGLGEGQDVKALGDLQDNNAPTKLEEVKGYENQKKIEVPLAEKKTNETLDPNGNPYTPLIKSTELDTARKTTNTLQTIDNIGGGAVGAGMVLGVGDSNDNNKKFGETAITTPETQFGAGVVGGSNINADSTNLDKHGQPQIQDNFKFTKNKETIQTKSENEVLSDKKANPMGVDKFLEAETKLDTFGNRITSVNAADQDKDNNVSPKEIKHVADLNQVDKDTNLVVQEVKQAEEALQSIKLAPTPSGDRAQEKVDKTGLKGKTKKVAEFRAKTAGNETTTKRFNNPKDAKVVGDFDKNDYTVDDATKGEVAPKLKEKEKINQNAKNMKEEMQDTLSQVKDLYQDTRANLAKQYPKMKAELLNELAGKTVMNKLSSMGLTDANTTRQTYNQAIGRVVKGNSANFTKEEKSALTNMKALQKTHEMALKTGNTKTAEATKNAMNLISKTDEFQSAKQKSEVSMHKINKQVDKINKEYSNAGLMKVNKNGSVSFRDSGAELEKMSGKELLYKANKYAGHQDGQVINTVNAEGMKVEKVKDIMGGNTTDNKTAVKGHSRTGNYANEVTYHAAEYVDPKTIANVSQGSKYLWEAASITGASKLLKVVKK